MSRTWNARHWFCTSSHKCCGADVWNTCFKCGLNEPSKTSDKREMRQFGGDEVPVQKVSNLHIETWGLPDNCFLVITHSGLWQWWTGSAQENSFFQGISFFRFGLPDDLWSNSFTHTLELSVRPFQPWCWVGWPTFASAPSSETLMSIKQAKMIAAWEAESNVLLV